MILKPKLSLFGIHGGIVGTSKRERKYKKIPDQPTQEIQYRVLINNNYYLEGFWETWEAAEMGAKRYIGKRNMRFAIVAGGSNGKY